MAKRSTEINQNLIQQYLDYFPGEVVEFLNTCTPEEIMDFLSSQNLSIAGNILLKLNSTVVTDLLEIMDESYLIQILPQLDAYACAMILSRISPEARERNLSLLPDHLQKQIREILEYPRESAGYIMDTLIIPFSPETPVSRVLTKLRDIGDRKIHNIYVVDRDQKLIGKVPIQVIAIAKPDEKLGDLMEESFSIHVMSPQEEVVELLNSGKMVSLPVVDLDNKLLGVIRHDALIKAAESEASEDVQAIFGAGREERALSKVPFAIKKRLPWLEINLATAFLAASIVGIFEETIARITVLAVFLPVVAGQSGNTGSQALAVTIRGLALREIRIVQWFKVAKKELIVGFINGVAVALTTSLIVYIWASSFGLALVIGISMVFSMAIAGFSGAVIPIILKAFGQDPAQSSSIVLTTVTDIVGFFSFLGLATILGSMIEIS